MSADQKVRIVLRNPSWDRNGKSKWFFQRENDRGQQEYVSVPRQASSMSPELAIIARDKFRRLGSAVHIEDMEGNGPLFEKEAPSETVQVERGAQHEIRFVPLAGGGVDGLGYLVRHNPQRGWYARATDVPSLVAEHRDLETIWGDTPEEVANKIIGTWGIRIAVPFADPAAAAVQRQQAAPQTRTQPGIRHGDRSRI